MSELSESTQTSQASRRATLLRLVSEMGRVVVAFSGGVDSAVVAKAAQLACGEAAIAATADSPSVPRAEIEAAVQLAHQIGIAHHVVRTEEFGSDDYLRNDGNRCFHCKNELYTRFHDVIAGKFDFDVIVNGANLDDRGDHRPGMRAAELHNVRSPLIEAGFTKQDVRDLAREWELPVWDKPASPCLSSRIAYGLEVTPERVGRVEQAEDFLRREFCLREFRVRHEANELARIEASHEDIPRLMEAANRQRIAEELRKLGFRCVTIDLDGFRSGSMNDVLPVEQLQVFHGERSVSGVTIRVAGRER